MFVHASPGKVGQQETTCIGRHSIRMSCEAPEKLSNREDPKRDAWSSLGIGNR